MKYGFRHSRRTPAPPPAASFWMGISPRCGNRRRERDIGSEEIYALQKNIQKSKKGINNVQYFVTKLCAYLLMRNASMPTQFIQDLEECSSNLSSSTNFQLNDLKFSFVF